MFDIKEPRGRFLFPYLFRFVYFNFLHFRLREYSSAVYS